MKHYNILAFAIIAVGLLATLFLSNHASSLRQARLTDHKKLWLSDANDRVGGQLEKQLEQWGAIAALVFGALGFFFAWRGPLPDPRSFANYAVLALGLLTLIGSAGWLLLERIAPLFRM